jgi:hypothetical protein
MRGGLWLAVWLQLDLDLVPTAKRQDAWSILPFCELRFLNSRSYFAFFLVAAGAAAEGAARARVLRRAFRRLL